MMKDDLKKNLGFTYRKLKSGEVLINRFEKQVTKLKGKKAACFIDDMLNSSFVRQQQIMARITGNYKRGNERNAKKHARNQNL